MQLKIWHKYNRTCLHCQIYTKICTSMMCNIICGKIVYRYIMKIKLEWVISVDTLMYHIHDIQCICPNTGGFSRRGTPFPWPSGHDFCTVQSFQRFTLTSEASKSFLLLNCVVIMSAIMLHILYWTRVVENTGCRERPCLQHATSTSLAYHYIPPFTENKPVYIGYTMCYMFTIDSRRLSLMSLWKESSSVYAVQFICYYIATFHRSALSLVSTASLIFGAVGFALQWHRFPFWHLWFYPWELLYSPWGLH